MCTYANNEVPVGITRQVSRRDRERISVAERIAETSELRYKVGAAIFHGTKCIAISPNLNKSHPEHLRYYSEHTCSIHAEHAAILKARRSVGGSTIYIARPDRKNSRMCPDCYQYIVLSGISAAVYWYNGGLVKELL